MPTDHKPLFRPEAVRPKVRAFALPPQADRGKIAKWAKMFAGGGKSKLKETEVRDEFLYDIFRDALGYVTVSENPADYSFKKEQFVQVDGTYADAGFGRFGGAAETPLIVLEGKGPNDPLDRPYAGRKRSAFEQALLYALNLRIDWYVVTNLRETRLYCKQADQFTFERFDTARLAADEDEWKRFVYLLGAERVLEPAGNHLTPLLAESAKIGRELTNEFYRDYRKLRELSFAALRQHNPDRPPAALLTATQKVLDRVLFIAFCEDRGLLPSDSIARAYRHADPYHPRPVWRNFVGLFNAVDRGNKDLNIWQYNGGLYAKDDFLDTLSVPDEVCEGFKKLAEYHYGDAADGVGKLIDVEILGHVFEQSISDLEEMHRAVVPAVAGVAAVESGEPSKRKKEGAFYTPAFVTRYILTETLGAVVRDRFERYRQRLVASTKKYAKLFADPNDLGPAEKSAANRAALAKFWAGWLEELETIRIVDPACGSGAFLIEAFDQMFAEYEKAESVLTALGSPSGLFETRKTILTNNIFGMDLNSEAVEIARLSSWIKTAEVGKVLTTLDANVVRGNSVVGDPSPLEFWRATFPAAFAAGGFDVVVGNPPYVRQEWIKADKPYLQAHYKAYDGVADLYVYFYELGLNILKPGGRLGYIVTNKWMKAGYGENLRKLYGECAWVEQVVDFGHAKQIFPDADVFPCIVVARRPDAGPPPADVRVCSIPRGQLRIDDLTRQIQTDGVRVPRSRLGAAPWNLEPPGVTTLMEKIKANGVPLKEFAGVTPLRGILTGFNEAFLIDAATKDRLVNADPESEPLFKPYMRGQDIDRWAAEWAGLWMIAMKSSANYTWPWSNAGADAEAIFAQTYPALHKHMIGHRAKLEARQDQGRYWWELRQCAYWDTFDNSKIMYQEIQTYPTYCLDISGYLTNNKIFILNSSDSYIVAVLNSPLGWWYAFRYLPHMINDTLTPVGEFMVGFPIARPTPEARSEVEGNVGRLVALKGAMTAGSRDVLDWLRAEFGIAKPSQKLAAPAELSAADFLAEVRKIRGRSAPLGVADVKRLNEAHTASVLPLHANAREALHLERRLRPHARRRGPAVGDRPAADAVRALMPKPVPAAYADDMNYADAIAFWFGRINYEVRSAAVTDLKLERMRALLRLLGDPQDRLRIVHVTGTKGKGSVCAMLEAMLRAAGYRVGLFTSPHLERVEERFQVNRASISEAEFCTLMAEVAAAVLVLDKSAEWPGPTFFEISTAVGLLHFVRRRVDVALLEVGLGGRFDSTNVCNPLLTILTSVGYDHMAQLGTTLAAIAFQKAGILKRNVPCISGAVVPEARDVVRRVAAELRAPLIELGSERLGFRRLGNELWVFGPTFNRIGLHPNLLGAHQDANAALAVGAVDALNAAGLTIPERAVRDGLRNVVWPARIECVQREPFAVVVDSAHNVPSVEALVTTLREAFPTASPRIAVFAVSNDKRYREMLAILGAYFTHVELTVYTYNARSVPAETLAETLREAAPGLSHAVHPHPIAAWNAARLRASAGGLVVICGSVFLAGELRSRILNDLGAGV